MWSISYISAVLIGIIISAISWFVSRWYAHKAIGNHASKLNELTEKLNQSTKQLKKEKGQVAQWRTKAESWKQEFHGLTNSMAIERKEFKERLTLQDQRISSLKSDYDTAKRDHDRYKTQSERLTKEVERLKTKYKTDVSDGKTWRVDRDKLMSELKSTQSKYEKSHKSAIEYKTKYEQQEDKINKTRVLERELRSLKTKSKKLTEDVTYWEKKHYDIHHELAELKTESGVILGKYKEVVELRKGDEIMRENLMSQIQEFKSKFVTVNNKYRELVSKN